MADWTDGSQYAPLQRPDGFAAPRTAALDVAEPDENLATGRPVQQPGDFRPPAEAPDLAELVPEQGPLRDPSEPFDTAGGAQGAWGAAHAATWNPRMPLGDVPAPQPGPAFPPPAGPPVVPVAAPGAGAPQGAWPAAAPPAAVPQPPQPLGVGQHPGLQQLPPPTGSPVPLPPPAPPVAPAPGPTATQVAAGPPAQPPAGWQPNQQWNPAPQKRSQGGVADYLGGRKGVTIGVLLFGFLVPSLAYLMIFVASFVSQARGRGAQLLRSVYNLVFVVVVLLWVATMTGTMPGLPFDGISRFFCLLLIAVNLYASHLDRNQRQR